MSQEHFLFLSLSFSFSTSSSPGKVVAVTCEVGGGGAAHPSFSSVFYYALLSGMVFFLFFFFGTFFLKVAPHSVVRVHPISLPVLIVLAVNTGCLCIFPAHYQQIALIMQIHPSHCALHSAQVIKHNQCLAEGLREKRMGFAAGPVSHEQSFGGCCIKKLLKSAFSPHCKIMGCESNHCRTKVWDFFPLLFVQ